MTDIRIGFLRELETVLGNKEEVIEVISGGIQSRNRKKVSPHDFSVGYAEKKSEGVWGEGFFDTRDRVELLSAGGELLAFSGFEVYENGIEVKQFQGYAKSSSEERGGFEMLKCLNWIEIHLRLLAGAAALAGMHLGVTPAHRTKHYQITGGIRQAGVIGRDKEEEIKTRLTRNIERAVQGCGFKYDAKRELYVLA